MILPREREETVAGARHWKMPRSLTEHPRTLLRTRLMDAYEVSTLVNYARNDGPEVIARVG